MNNQDVDLDLLNQIIDDMGISMSKLSRRTGISRPSLYNKLAGDTKITLGDVRGFKTALHLNRSQVAKIFSI